ncbi:AraC family transcriptional regulator [soil metagenome]
MRRRTAGCVLSLSEMAEIAYLSPYHFSRTFRRVTGIPPGEFMNALRLERAKHLLLTTDLSVGEVCHEVGYNSQGTFTSRFKQLVGLSPGRMRQLPEELTLAFESMEEGRLSITPPYIGGGGVAGRVTAPGLQRALIFVGLFVGAVPQGYPVSGIVLTSPGEFRIFDVPDGHYHLMAAATPIFDGPESLLLPGSSLRVGRAERVVTVRRGTADGYASIALRPLRNTDPPVLVSLPSILIKLVGSSASPTY